MNAIYQGSCYLLSKQNWGDMILQAADMHVIIISSHQGEWRKYWLALVLKSYIGHLNIWLRFDESVNILSTDYNLSVKKNEIATYFLQPKEG